MSALEMPNAPASMASRTSAFIFAICAGVGDPAPSPIASTRAWAAL